MKDTTADKLYLKGFPQEPERHYVISMKTANPDLWAGIHVVWASYYGRDRVERFLDQRTRFHSTQVLVTFPYEGAKPGANLSFEDAWGLQCLLIESGAWAMSQRMSAGQMANPYSLEQLPAKVQHDVRSHPYGYRVKGVRGFDPDLERAGHPRRIMYDNSGFAYITYDKRKDETYG